MSKIGCYRAKWLNELQADNFSVKEEKKKKKSDDSDLSLGFNLRYTNSIQKKNVITSSRKDNW